MGGETIPYTHEEILALDEDAWPTKGIFCAKCKKFIPIFSINSEEIVRIRKLDTIYQMNAIKNATGCNLPFAKIWALHPHGPVHPLNRNGPPCPFCNVLLFSFETRQCVDCGWDWHDKNKPINLLSR